jgi:hypothetical protein
MNFVVLLMVGEARSELFFYAPKDGGIFSLALDYDGITYVRLLLEVDVSTIEVRTFVRIDEIGRLKPLTETFEGLTATAGGKGA